MIKKIFASLCLSIMFLPSLALAQSQIAPPNLVEIRIDDDFVDQNNVSIRQDQVLSLRGTALKDTQVFLYFVNDEDNPKIAQTNVDKDGNWQYVLSQVLPVGHYSVQGEVHSGSKISAQVNLFDLKVTKMSISSETYLFIALYVFIAVILILFLVYLKKHQKILKSKT